MSAIGRLDIEVDMQLQKMDAKLATMQKSINAATAKNTSLFKSMGENIERSLKKAFSLSSVAKLTLGVTSVSAAVGLLSRGIRDVINNIESIPNIKPEIAGGVVHIREKFKGLTNDAKSAVGTIVSAFDLLEYRVQKHGFFKGIFKTQMGIGIPEDKAEWEKLNVELMNTKKHEADLAHESELLAKAYNTLIASRKKLNEAGLSEAGVLEILREEYKKLETALGFLSEGTSGYVTTQAMAIDLASRIKTIQFNIDAKAIHDLDAQFKELENTIIKSRLEMLAAQDEYNAAVKKTSFENLSSLEKIRSIDSEIASLKARQAALTGGGTETATEYYNVGLKILSLEKERVGIVGEWRDKYAAAWAGVMTPAEKYEAELSRIANLTRDLLKEGYNLPEVTELSMRLGEKATKDYETALVKLVEKQESAAKTLEKTWTDAWETVGDRAGQAFADMVLTGEASFSELANIVARSMLEIVARMAIINPILNAMAGNQALPAFFSLAGARADGGRTNPGSAYLIGERGPELWVPDSAGAVVPNHAITSTDGRGEQTIIYADMRGASVDAVVRLEKMVRSLNASIEPRSVAAWKNAERRNK